VVIVTNLIKRPNLSGLFLCRVDTLPSTQSYGKVLLWTFTDCIRYSNLIGCLISRKSVEYLFGKSGIRPTAFVISS
jgi:hypothetical protein